MKKLIAILMTIAIVGVVVAGCGGGEETDAGGTTTTAPADEGTEG